MNQVKHLAFCPGDDVHVKIHFKSEKYSVLRVEVIEIDEPYNDEINVEL